MNAPKPNRNRKKSTGSEQVKHRRTRSGCFTCRSRRVKCDEARPICERCRKGGRECVYPEPSTSTKHGGQGSSKGAAQSEAQEAVGSSSDEYDDELDPEAIPGLSESHRGSISQPLSDNRSTTRQSSEASSGITDRGTPQTPSTEGSIGPSYQMLGSSRLKQKASTSSWGASENMVHNWSHLPADLQFYLNYFFKSLSHVHYSMKMDPSNFLKTHFLEIALKNESLLYGIIGFSAFHRTLHNPEGKIQDFLKYYNLAVSFLLKSLRKGEQRTTGTLLAILQLATIEEFLGDWVNLLGHQKAACEILTELYTPQTIMESGMTRLMLGWYMRFDAFASLMSGFEMVLDRKWMAYAEDFLYQQTFREPGNLVWKLEFVFAQLRLIAMDMSTIFAKNGKGEFTDDQFSQENEVLRQRLISWRANMDPALHDTRYMVTDFSNAPPVEPDDIVNPYLPGVIYSGPMWPLNHGMVDWHSMKVMHSYQTAKTMKTAPTGELLQAAYASCQIVETCEFWPGSPPGILLPLQASLGVAMLCLPRDQRHAMWCRRKLARIEANGYIYPLSFRTKMSNLFRDQSCMHWWLPNDEGFSPIIRSIRKFVEERSSLPTDVPKEDLREMKQIFAALKLDDNAAPKESEESEPAPDVAQMITAQYQAQGYDGSPPPWYMLQR